MKLTLPSPDVPLKIGTRGSPLALAQAYAPTTVSLDLTKAPLKLL